MIYFWSDTHFNHESIIRYCSRPYASVEEMNETLIERWNEVVGPTDTVYHVGDFGFKPLLPKKLPPSDQAAALAELAVLAGDIEKFGQAGLEVLFERLNGHKHLIRGNHDMKNRAVLRLQWESQHDLYEAKDHGMRAVLCHYPLESWPSGHHGVLMIHGHCHGNLRHVLPHRFDVGADVWKTGPVPFDLLWQIADAQQFEATDHHE